MEVIGEPDNRANTAATTTIICNNYLHYHAATQYVLTADRTRSVQKYEDLDLIERAVSTGDDTIIATGEPYGQVRTNTGLVKIMSTVETINSQNTHDMCKIICRTVSTCSPSC
jgi:uncharacterized protein YjlB